MDSAVIDKLYENKYQDIVERRVNILKLLADGYCIKDIQSTLFISRATVKRDIQFLLNSFDAKNRTNLVVKAIMLDIIEINNES